ncbi:MAG: ABC transporter ATP-binding protein (plasmid) [Candidatus Symbiodolus clandestinus]
MVFFWKFHRAYKIRIIFFIFFSIFIGLHGLINSYFTKNILDYLSIYENNPLLIERILWSSVFVVLNFKSYNLSWRIINYINLKTAPEIKNNIINYTFNYVHRQTAYFFQDNLSGSVSSNIHILVDNIERVSSIISVRIIRGAVQLVSALFSMYFIHPIFSISLLTWAIIFIFTSYFFSKKAKIFSYDYSKSQSCILGKIVDSIANFLNVRIFSRINFETVYLQRSLNFMKEKFYRKEWFLIKFYFIQGLSITCLIGLMLYFLIQLKINNRVTIGEFTFILGLCFYVTENVWDFTEQITQVNDALGRCNQSLKSLFSPIEIQDKENANSLMIQEGKIVFDKISFNYRGENSLFNNESIVIEPGQKIGIIGLSGSGKSTLVNLLLRLYEVTSGKIMIDGQDIRNVTQRSLHANIGVIPQETSLFHRSLMENIRYGRIDASDDEVIEAAKYANIHEFICKLPQKYRSVVGEQGVKLSGGQRQRIAIARILLKNSPILILDESTCQLDSITEKTIKKTLTEVMLRKTAIVIAHRLSTLKHMDRILVFKEGKIIEDGTHLELLSQGEMYQALWAAQIGDFFE